jgi:type III restriction enzyme
MVDRYLRERVRPLPPAETIDVFCSPYYGWVIEHLRDAIRPDISQGEAPIVPIYEARRGPGSTGEVDFWTSREVREVVKSHINYVVADTRTWEESAAYLIDTNDAVDAFVKNAGLGFAIPYLYNSEAHDYVPDFIVRLKTEPPLHLIIEVKGYDERADIKAQAAQKWVDAVSADGAYGRWAYGLAKKPAEVKQLIVAAAAGNGSRIPA